MDAGVPMARTLAEANARLAALWREVMGLRAADAELRAGNARLAARVEELEARLAQDSSNSSRPPSSDPPGTPPRRPPRSGRTRGAQPGHPARVRLLVPPERVDRVVEHYPAACARCRTPLRADPALVVDDPACHQVTEVPPVRAVVTEHWLHRVRCPACGGQDPGHPASGRAGRGLRAPPASRGRAVGRPLPAEPARGGRGLRRPAGCAALARERRSVMPGHRRGAGRARR